MSFRIQRCLLPIALLLLAACAPVGPDYRPPATVMPGTWAGDRGQTATGLADSAERWWGLFDDPVLTALVERALEANHDLRIATSRITAARARLRLTSAAANPTIDAGAGYSRSRRSENTGGNGGGASSNGSQDLFEAGFDADWEIDLFGGQRRAVESAAATLSATEEDRRDVLVTLEAEVARSYFDLTGNRRLLATARDTMDAQEKTLSVVDGRLRLGLASGLESSQAKTQVSLIAARIPDLEQQIAANINQLALLLDLPPAAMARRLDVSAPSFRLPATLPAGLPSDLLRRRPDIRRAERTLAAATAEVGVATADLFPRFSLAALAGLQSASLSDLVSSGSRYWSIGPSFSLPLFDRGRLYAALDITEAELAEMLASYEKTVLAALVETETALVHYSREQERRDRLAEAVATARQAAVFNEGLYAAGLADLTDVLDSQRTLLAAEDQLIDSERQLAQNVVALYKALGGGWEISGPAAAAAAADGKKPHTETTGISP
ncbi:MAG: efflux transporter outer membrane subunit [Desulfobulbaceae bacterium]|nr:MAG: efflux transporter outer membrane subunit [Desulfobulbaceae bacterium]